MKMQRYLRRLVPSLATLSYNPLVKGVLAAGDVLPSLFFPEFRSLPPNYMRVRIGAGQRLFHSQMVYLSAARNFWYFAFERELVALDSRIVDIGVGCGRYAHHLRDYEFKGLRFQGHYWGIDIDEEMLAWCRQRFDTERFSFIKSSHQSATYLNQQGSKSFYRIPLEDGSVDLVFSTSLYTHLLEEELRNYTQEACRILAPGKSMAMYAFCIDHPPPSINGRHTFSHRLGAAHVESVHNPEAAVAYTSSFLTEMCREAGFRSASIITARGEAQPLLLATK